MDEQIRLNRKLQKEIDELREEMDYSSYSYEDYLSNKQQFEEHMRRNQKYYVERVWASELSLALNLIGGMKKLENQEEMVNLLH